MLGHYVKPIGPYSLEYFNFEDGSTEYRLYHGDRNLLWFRLAARGHVLVRFQLS